MSINAVQINAFVKPFIQIMEEIVPKSAPLSLGSMYIKKNKTSNFDVSIYCMVSGNLDGKVVLSLPVDTALEMAEEMMSKQVDSFNDSAQSAVTEFMNMVIGHAIINLKHTDNKILLSPPRVIYDKNYSIAIAECNEPITIPIYTKIGDIELDMVLAEKE